MNGIAIWTQSGSTDSMESLFGNLAPGRIYLFHTTDNDLTKLLELSLIHISSRGSTLRIPGLRGPVIHNVDFAEYLSGDVDLQRAGQL